MLLICHLHNNVIVVLFFNWARTQISIFVLLIHQKREALGIGIVSSGHIKASTGLGQMVAQTI